MQFSVLGPLQVTDDDAALSLGGPRQRSVLALLLLATGRAVAADRLLTEIWGDKPPDGARDSLYTYVSNLRRVLHRERIVGTAGGYRLELADGDTVDAEQVAGHLATARRALGSDPTTAIALIDQSLARWRGRAYEGLEDLPSVAPEATRIDELRLRALEDRIDAQLRTDTLPEIGELELLTGDHPYRERYWELLARVLYRAGRQADALGALSRLRRALADDLGLDPSPAITRLEEQILVQDPALDHRASPPTNLPSPVSSFVGRLDDMERLQPLVLEHRLVTVTGPGGVGKTRLAIHAASRMIGSFPDGVWLVDLAPVATPVTAAVATPVTAAVATPEAVADAVADALQVTTRPGADPTDSLLARLRATTTLLVLDNCEHVVDAVRTVAARLLAGAHGLHVLATSRRSLGGPDEIVFPLAGLRTADGDAAPAGAEILFTERAAAVRPGFELDADGVVTAICEHLDGLPLAIELAAARADALSPVEIERHLLGHFRFLTEEHSDRAAHRSLQASFDWSYDLLTRDDRRGFDRLGVFEGPFTAAAAAAVLELGAESEVVATIRRLLAAALLEVAAATGSKPSRYRLLETARRYTRTHLREAGVWPLVADLHDRHYRDRCVGLRDQIFGSGRTEARIALDAELAGHETAFDRLVATGRLDDALDMAWSLSHTWLFAGRLGRGIGRVEELVAATTGRATRARADALCAGSFLLMFITRFETATTWADEAIEIYRSAGDERGLAYALARRGHLAFAVGDVPTALEHLQESLSICERIGYADGTGWPLTLLGQARLWGGDESDEVRQMLAEGRLRFIATGDTYGQLHANMFIPNVGQRDVVEQLRYANESIELAERPDADPLIRPSAYHNLAFSVWNAGEHERAAGLNRLATRSAGEMGATVTSGMAFLQGGFFAGMSGDAARAAVLFGAGDRHFAMRLAPFHERQLQPGRDAAREAVGDERFDDLHARGMAMSVDEATAYLLTDPRADIAAPGDGDRGR